MNDAQDRALLISPAYDKSLYNSAESLGLRSIAAVLVREGAAVRVVDECPAELPDQVAEYAARARLIGVGVLFTRQLPAALALAAGLRAVAPAAHLTIGGQGVQFLWQRVLEDCPELDSACLYEGDHTVRDLWHRLRAGRPFATVEGLAHRRDGRIVTAFRPPVADLDELPFPHREEGPRGYPDGHATMSTSRGCTAHCTFCQSGNYGNRHHRLPRWRARSAANVIAEVTRLVHDHGIRAISFVDDDFFGGDGRGRERALEFARLLRHLPHRIRFSLECRINELDAELLRTLRAVGLRRVLIGIEAANDADLVLFAKKTTNARAEDAIRLLRRLGIDFSLGFIMFHPLSSPGGVADNLAFLARNRVGAYRQVVNRLELYPGAPLTGYFHRKGVALHEADYRIEYEFTDPAMNVLRRSFCDVLKPYVPVERRCQAALFQAVVADQADRIRGLRRIVEDISESLVGHACDCLDRVAAGSEPDKDPALRSAVFERTRELTGSIC